MATACEFLRRISDSVACPVCFLIFDKPKSLPCGHTFCLNCIQLSAQLRSSSVIDDDEYIYNDEYALPAEPVTVSFVF